MVLSDTVDREVGADTDPLPIVTIEMQMTLETVSLTDLDPGDVLF